jgi:hypothetical protein
MLLADQLDNINTERQQMLLADQLDNINTQRQQMLLADLLDNIYTERQQITEMTRMFGQQTWQFVGNKTNLNYFILL